MEYRPAHRLALDADAEISKTRAPGELNADTSLAYTRARAGRTTLHSSMTHHLSAITSGTIEYTFSQDRVVGAADTRTHTARVGADRRWSARDEVSVDYRLQQMFFGLAGSPASMATSHALSLGWNHSINRLASPKAPEPGIKAPPAIERMSPPRRLNPSAM